MFPCEIFQFFDAQIFEILEILYTPSCWFQRPLLSLSQKDIRQGGYDMEVFAEWKKIQKKEKGENVKPVTPIVDGGEHA